ncbi:hypothetical protein [Halosegnis longus]|uniref:hypothetical protein n=1 Tax=Halosegnis longus TaxID=2216012 RepID=UPI00096A5AD0|nr:hypothetical protein [Salella cibi]
MAEVKGFFNSIRVQPLLSGVASRGLSIIIVEILSVFLVCVEVFINERFDPPLQGILGVLREDVEVAVAVQFQRLKVNFVVVALGVRRILEGGMFLDDVADRRLDVLAEFLAQQVVATRLHIPAEFAGRSMSGWSSVVSSGCSVVCSASVVVADPSVVVGGAVGESSLVSLAQPASPATRLAVTPVRRNVRRLINYPSLPSRR